MFTISLARPARRFQLRGQQPPLARRGLAVPVFRGLTLKLNYDAQRSYNSYVLPGLQDLDAANNFYTGGLTYDIPRLSSSLSISGIPKIASARAFPDQRLYADRRKRQLHRQVLATRVRRRFTG